MAKEGELLWDPSGTALLVRAHSRGDTSLYCLSSSLTARVLLDAGGINYLLWQSLSVDPLCNAPLACFLHQKTFTNQKAPRTSSSLCFTGVAKSLPYLE